MKTGLEAENTVGVINNTVELMGSQEDNEEWVDVVD